MPALIDWVDTLKDVWTGFVLEVVFDATRPVDRKALAELLRRTVNSAQAGYVMTKIILPDEPGIDPAQFTTEGWEALLRSYAAGEHKDIMVLGGLMNEPEDYYVASIIWNRGGLFRLEASARYVREIGEGLDATEALVDLARTAWATCNGMSGWANLAVAGEPEQADEVARLVQKWGRKSAVSLVDLTPPGRDPVPVVPWVRGACWLTMLSADDIVAIGGLEALDEKLPEDVRLELFEDGGALIQLTPTPMVPEEDEATETKYRALAELVAPLVGPRE
jgi:hypothetical protein